VGIDKINEWRSLDAITIASLMSIANKVRLLRKVNRNMCIVDTSELSIVLNQVGDDGENSTSNSVLVFSTWPRLGR
jgi:hypothetical protein